MSTESQCTMTANPSQLDSLDTMYFLVHQKESEHNRFGELDI
jgi:hypothetical protein